MKQSYKSKKINDEILILIKIHREGNRLAGEKIINLIHRFVWKIASRFTKDVKIQEDLVQEAELVVLTEVIPRFDLTSNASFLSYAIFWIMHAMESYIRKNLFICELPSRIETYLKSQKINPDDINTCGKSMFSYVINKMCVNQSFITREGKSIFDTIPSEDIDSDEKYTNIDEYLSLIEYASDRDKKIMEGHFKENKSLTILGKQYGVSRERIRQIVSRSKDRIKNKLAMEKI